MWFRNAVRKFIQHFNTTYVGNGSYSRAEYVEREGRIYLFPLRNESDPAKEVMWRAYQELHSPHLPAFRKEIYLTDDLELIEIYSVPFYLIFGSSDKFHVEYGMMMEKKHSLEKKYNMKFSKKFETNLKASIWTMFEIRYAYVLDELKEKVVDSDALLKVVNLIDKKANEVVNEYGFRRGYRWDIRFPNMAVNTNGGIVFLDPIYFPDLFEIFRMTDNNWY